MNRLAIVVLNWNCAEDSVKCMESLFVSSEASPFIVLVDNASGDNSLEVLRAYATDHKGSVHLIENPVNSGYTGGNNVGFTYALGQGYQYIGTLNPDATANKDWQGLLVKELEDNPELGIVGGQLRRADNKTLDSTGDFYTTWGIPGPRGRDQLINKAPTNNEDVFGITGGGFIARAEVFKKVGLLDERYFMYFEDVDLCFRTQLAGYKIRYVANAVAFHKISASTNKVPGLAITQTFKNLPMLFTKNVPFKLCFSIYPRFILAYFLILGHAVVKGRGIPALKGFALSWTLIPHMFRERWRIQASRTASDAYIDSIILHDIPPEQTGLRKFRKIFTGK